MYKIWVAKYKHSKSIFSKFIRFKQKYQDLWPDSIYSHSEIVLLYSKQAYDLIKNLDVLTPWNFICIDSEKESYFKKFNLWFSSSEEDGWTRFKFINDDKWNWDYDIIEVTREQFIAILKACNKRNYRRYWWLAIIFTQALKTFWFKNKKAPFCSQVVLEVLQEIGLFAWENAIEVNPWQLSSLTSNWKLQKEYNKIKKLYI